MLIDPGRIAIVGLGRAGEFAIRALQALEIPATLGIDPRGRMATAANLLPEGALFVDLEAILDGQCEMVVVSASSPAPPQLVQQLLSRHPPTLRRIWCEKPMVS